MKIYLASSWRNPIQDIIVELLRASNYEVYDFKDPKNNYFNWKDIYPNFPKWTPNQIKESLTNSVAKESFEKDINSIKWCDVCILLLPCGKSAHLELGLSHGIGKKTMILALPEVGPYEPELMYSMADAICISQYDMLQKLKEFENLNNRIKI